MIRLLITEDSKVIRRYLEEIFSNEPDFEVVGTAQNGAEAVEMVGTLRPDVITMDIHMPVMNGFIATRKIMEKSPTPIVIVSASYNPDEVEKTFKTMEAGAVAAMEKPQGLATPDTDLYVRELIQTVRTMSKVKVVRRWSKDKFIKKSQPARPVTIEKKVIPSKEPVYKKPKISTKKITIVAMGASTGGPIVLEKILSGLPKNFPVPVVIVQHIAKGFLPGMASWLTDRSGFNVRIPDQGEFVQPHTAYLAPDGFQIGIDKEFRVLLNDDYSNSILVPSVSYLFNSVAESFGEHAIGVLLTGMGRDGAQELGLIKQKGGITIVQDKESSIIHGMPGEAIKLGSHQYVLHSDIIANKIVSLVS